jgi:hypothetical protein
MRVGDSLILFGLFSAWSFLVPSVAIPPQEEPQVPAERTNLATLVKSCRKCHEDVCTEWEGSQHAQSWTDPVFQAAVKDLPDGGDSCARCHAPLEILDTGIGKLPKPRKLDRDLGVNCVTCHLSGNEYHGPFDSPGHGGVTANPAYREPGICLSCHGQPEARKEHDQGTSFLAAKARGASKSCQECHQPEVERKLVTSPTIKEKYTIGVQKVRLHTFTGARRNLVVKGAAELTLKFESTEVVATVTALTGHGLPASQHREVVLGLVQLGADGQELATERKQWRYSDGTALEAGLPTPVRVTLRAGAREVRATLMHHLLPTAGRDALIPQEIATVSGTVP